MTAPAWSTAGDQPMLAQELIRIAVYSSLDHANKRHRYAWTINSPGDWETPKEDVPNIKIRTTGNSKKPIGDNKPILFNSAIHIQIDAVVRADDAPTAQRALDLIEYQIEQALLNDSTLLNVISQFTNWSTARAVTSDSSKHTGGVRFTIDAETQEVFPNLPQPDCSPWPPTCPPEPVKLDTIKLEGDMVNPFDKLGNYGPLPDFPNNPPAAPPRQSGPDGRVEIGANITSLNE